MKIIDSKKPVQPAADNQTKNTEKSDQAQEIKSNSKPKKSNKVGYLIILIVFLMISGYQSYMSYFFTPSVKEVNTKESPAEVQDAVPETQETAKSVDEKKSANSTGASSTPNSTATTPTENNSTQVESTELSEKEKMIEYFIDIALHFTDDNKPLTTGIERWVKNPFYVGFGPDTLDLRESTCVDGFIRDFNNASSTAKLQKNREAAEIKIYAVAPDELSQYGGTDSGWGFAYGYKNSSNERYKGEIFISNALPDDDAIKCYLMRHEMMHNMGFRGHSDRYWEGLMAVPGVGRNMENIMSEVDTKAIQMLYNTGLPLKSNEAETRAYLNANYPS